MPVLSLASPRALAPTLPVVSTTLGRAVLLLLSLAGCDVFNDELKARIVVDAGPVEVEPLECRTHAECVGREGGEHACVKPEGRCVPLTSPACPLVTGDLSVDGAIVIGSMFSVTGAQGATNVPRQQSAMLAVEAINSFGGVPGAGSSKRPLVLVSCDEAADLDGAATHLVNELKVPAIVGPNVSQDVISVSNRYSVAGGTLLISPTAVASSIADLADNDLTWIMVPSDEQRAPLMRQQIGELEKQLKTRRPGEPIKLSIIHRKDALGTGTRTALNNLTLNGQTLAENVAPNVNTISIEPYEATAANQTPIVDRQLAFAPDIVVMAGLSEAITQIMNELEKRWGSGPRPYYVLIDSLKVPEVLAAATASDDLRRRIRGTGIQPTSRSQPVYAAFQVDYGARWPGSNTTISGMGPAYDATYAIAYALAATRDKPVSGASIAEGLRKLSDGGVELELASTKILAAFTQLTAGKSIDAIGTFAPLSWDDRGAPLGGRVEIWCIAAGSPTATYQSSTLSMDLRTGVYSGDYVQCE